MKCLQRKSMEKYDPRKRRQKIPLNIIQEGPSREDVDQPTVSPSGLKKKIPKHSSRYWKRLPRSNHGYAKPKVERDKNGDNKRKRNEEEYNRFAYEERPAKMRKSDDVLERANKVMERKLFQSGKKRPASHVRSPTPQKRQKTTKDDNVRTKEDREVPCTSREHSVPANFHLDYLTFHKIIGQGSYGKVALASHPETKRKLAVKVVQKKKLLEEDPKSVLIERQILERVGSSPFFTHAYGTFQTDDYLFFVMEYLRGGELSNLINSKAPLPTYTIRFIAAELLCALQHLHSHGIIHRDLKPDNILLDSYGHIKIADFGLSQVGLFGSKMTDSYVGTPGYMAPEVKKETPYKVTADYYSLGVILFEMATGKDASFASHKNSTYLRGINPDLRDVIERLLIRCPYRRQRAVKYLREHPFFSRIDWKELETGKATPPFYMSLGPKIDTHQKIEAVKLIPAITMESKKIPAELQKLFKGFNFTSNKWRKMLIRARQ